eukprot:7378142-Prymnesium_polylepis.1
MVGGNHDKGKRYTFFCIECNTTWSQLHPLFVGLDGDLKVSLSSRAFHLTDRRGPNGYRSNIKKGGCGLLLNKALAKSRNEDGCSCIHRNKDVIDIAQLTDRVNTVTKLFAPHGDNVETGVLSRRPTTKPKSTSTTDLESIVAQAVTLSSAQIGKKYMPRNMCCGAPLSSSHAHP